MIKPEVIKPKIIEVIKKRGPSLPIQISKDVGLSSLFVSAFLSELTDDKKIIVSTLKVGGSPLYLLKGQETQLENFFKFLHSKEFEAVELLKKNRILKDSAQDPAIRVALRAIKDFAFNFKSDEELYWRYLTVTEQEIIEKFNNKDIKNEELNIDIKKDLENIEEKTIEKINLEKIEKIPDNIPEKIEKIDIIEIIPNKIEEIIKPIGSNNNEILIEEKLEVPNDFKTSLMNELREKVKEIIKDIDNPDKKEEKLEEKLGIEKVKEKPKKETVNKSIPTETNVSNFNNPLAIKPVPKVEKVKLKSEFVLNVIEFLEKSGFKIIEEKEFSKKDYLCIAEKDTDLGPIAFLTLAKEKKSVSDIDLDSLLRQAQSLPLPALFLAPGDMNKKAKEYQQKYYSIMKFKKIE